MLQKICKKENLNSVTRVQIQLRRNKNKNVINKILFMAYNEICQNELK